MAYVLMGRIATRAAASQGSMAHTAQWTRMNALQILALMVVYVLMVSTHTLATVLQDTEENCARRTLTTVLPARVPTEVLAVME